MSLLDSADPLGSVYANTQCVIHLATGVGQFPKHLHRDGKRSSHAPDSAHPHHACLQASRHQVTAVRQAAITPTPRARYWSFPSEDWLLFADRWLSWDSNPDVTHRSPMLLIRLVVRLLLSYEFKLFISWIVFLWVEKDRLSIFCNILCCLVVITNVRNIFFSNILTV